MKQHMGKYEEARKYFDMYMSEYGGLDTFYTARAKKEIASIEYAATQTKISNAMSVLKNWATILIRQHLKWPDTFLKMSSTLLR